MGLLIGQDVYEDGTSYTNASNIISCGSLDSTADVFCLGALTVQSNDKADDSLDNSLDARNGGIRAQGKVIIEKATVNSSRLLAKDDITVSNTLLFATTYRDSEDGSINSIQSESGDVSLENSWVFTGMLIAGGNVSITGSGSRVWGDQQVYAQSDLTVTDCGYTNANDIRLGYESGGFNGINCSSLTVSNSRVETASISARESMNICRGSDVAVTSGGEMAAVLLGGAGGISGSAVTVSGLEDCEVGIWGSQALTIDNSSVSVDGSNPSAAIYVWGSESDSGLVLVNSAVSSPARFSVRKYPPIFDEETFCWVIATGTNPM